MKQFHYAGHSQDVHFGRGIVDSLGDTIADFGFERLLFCTSGSQRRSGKADRVEQALGSRISVSFDRVQPHVQEEQVNEVLGLARENNVDGVVALGGGSVLGMAKAVSDALQEDRTGTLARKAHPLEPALVPTIVIPTTYAGSEMTSVYGVTRPVDGGRRKITVSGRNVVPRVVIYDPELTLDLPHDLTGTSAMNALAHCFEALYSVKRDPLSSAAALGGIRAIGFALPQVHENSQDLQARAGLLEGAFLAGSALAQVSMAIHHGVCHVLGGSAGIPHGVANTIVLPHALRFNKDVAQTELAEAAIALDLARRDDDRRAAAELVIEWLDKLGDDLGLPKRLRDAGVDADDLPRLAEIALMGDPVKNNPRPVKDSAEMEDFLQEMW
jgi:maleylacetate reductase